MSIPSGRRRELISVYRDGLLNDTLPFWIPRCVDHEHGGFMMAMERDGRIVDTDKGVWQQARFTWLLGELYNRVESNERWLGLAEHGVRFLDRHCFDDDDGRMWFHVTRDGRPIRKRRYAFSESFAAIAYGEYAKATGDSHYADKASAVFDRFLSHNLDPDAAPAKYTDTRPTRSIGFPMIALVTAQELRQSIDHPGANEQIDRCIDDIRETFVRADIRCVMETVGANGELIDHFDGRTLNPGHAIECVWFILQEGRHRDDSQLIQLGCEMLDWMWDRGWDKTHGGMLYFVDLDGSSVAEYWHDMKFWWPHNETILATLLAWILTGEEKYARWHAEVHDWAYRHFPDAEHGEWFGYLHRDGTISSTLKGNLWKGPFHLPRMQLNAWQWLEESVGSNQSDGSI